MNRRLIAIGCAVWVLVDLAMLLAIVSILGWLISS